MAKISDISDQCEQYLQYVLKHAEEVGSYRVERIAKDVALQLVNGMIRRLEELLGECKTERTILLGKGVLETVIPGAEIAKRGGTDTVKKQERDKQNGPPLQTGLRSPSKEVVKRLNTLKEDHRILSQGAQSSLPPAKAPNKADTAPLVKGDRTPDAQDLYSKPKEKNYDPVERWLHEKKQNPGLSRDKLLDSLLAFAKTKRELGGRDKFVVWFKTITGSADFSWPLVKQTIESAHVKKALGDPKARRSFETCFLTLQREPERYFRGNAETD